ncbi:MLKL [Branchiostoma lanceolatum]|uniref:MLKL protein n=1 Tax=Branchiostoma lanceolatum TaxID=7740 RepID=A0A8K0A673_BRALA|nr:MLKL [Branchiostoma lanceolatum]
MWAIHSDRQDSQTSAMDLRREAEVLMKFQSENVVRVFGICTDPGNYLLVMEYAQLGTLRDVLQDKKYDLSWDRRVRMGLEGARGLYTLHYGKTSMLHCDVNTRKFLVYGDMHVKLTGFGLATTRSSARKLGRSSRKGRPSSTRHTVKFVAPERISDINTPYDDRAESYSFGIVLSEIASREPPFEGMNESDIAEFVKAGRIQDLPTDCPAKFRLVIDACRALNPALRPLSAEITDGLQDAFIQSVSMARDAS